MESPKNIDGKIVMVKKTVLTFSNFLSFSRILVVPPIIYLHQVNDQTVNTIVISLLVYAIFSDFLDGWVARLTNSISEFGKILDPIADKIAASLLFIYTVYLGWVPLWFVLFSIARDLFIMSGSGIIKYRRGKVAMSTMSGKVSVNFQALYWLIIFFYPQSYSLHPYFLGAAVAAMVVSLIDYAHRYYLIIKGADYN